MATRMSDQSLVSQLGEKYGVRYETEGGSRKRLKVRDCMEVTTCFGQYHPLLMFCGFADAFSPEPQATTLGSVISSLSHRRPRHPPNESTIGSSSSQLLHRNSSLIKNRYWNPSSQTYRILYPSLLSCRYYDRISLRPKREEI